MAEHPYNRPVPRAYGVALRHDNSDVLLVRASILSSAAGLWWLPGGGIDWRESPEEAVGREFLEETGLTVTSCDLLGVRSDVRERTNGEVVHTIRIIYVVTVDEGDLTHEADGTTDHAAWIPVADVANSSQLKVARYTQWAVRVATGQSASYDEK